MQTPNSHMFAKPLSLTAPSGLLLLSFALLAAITWALMSGAFQIKAMDMLGWMLGSQLDEVSRNVLLNIRAPRVLLGVITGAVLGMAGAVMQALFRNPLAEPGLVGLSAGASLGAVLAIVLTGGSLLLIGGFAFLGGLTATFLAYFLGKKSSHQAGLLLAGIAINSIIVGVMGVIIIHANDAQLRDLTFWNMGSLASADWTILAWLTPWSLALMTCLLMQWRALNALLLGEREAYHLGFHPSRLRWQLITLVALAVGPVVAVTGGIGFVGLVIPHLVRLWLGADHRWVLPASGIAGAIALTLADWLGRIVMAPSELPIGLVTCLLGGPFFIWLLLRGQRT
ncbi:MAG: iron ABC transporter permease [Zwartia sp.]|nr:iron ABC transporter permease [Zwartia sp.]MDO9024504.1 iron ABC transporter permease [Zwartia sp.]